VNRRHIKITYLLTAPEPALGRSIEKRRWIFRKANWKKFTDSTTTTTTTSFMHTKNKKRATELMVTAHQEDERRM